MYCTLDTLKKYMKNENCAIWLKDINQKDTDKAFEIEKIIIDENMDIILEFNPEYLI